MTPDDSRRVSLLPNHYPKTKSWQNDLEIRHALARENPLLPRTKVRRGWNIRGSTLR